MWKLNHYKDMFYWTIIICMITTSTALYTGHNFYQEYVYQDVNQTTERRVSITKATSTKVASAKEIQNGETVGIRDIKTPEEQYNYLMETNETFKNYINKMDVKRNNPGNLRCANQPNSWCDNGFASYDTSRLGFRGLIKQIEMDISRGDTIETFFHAYAPPSENNTNSYVQGAVELFNTSKQSKLSSLDTIKLAQYITFREHSVAIANY